MRYVRKRKREEDKKKRENGASDHIVSQVEVCECVVLCMKGAREGHEGMRGWVNELNQCWWHECEFEWMGLGKWNLFD